MYFFCSNYVHRCGRTARMGRMGCAVIFLLPNEEPFVTFVQNTRKVRYLNVILIKGRIKK